MNLTIFTHHRYIRLKPASMYSSKASITMPTPTRSCAVKYSSATQTPSINASSGVINVTSDTTLADKRLEDKEKQGVAQQRTTDGEINHTAHGFVRNIFRK